MKLSYSMKGLVLGIIFAAIYFLLAISAAGGGHGVTLFLAPFFPYALGFLLFPVIGFLADNLDSTLTKVLFLVSLAIHYGLILTVIIAFGEDDFPYFAKVWNSSPLLIILPLIFYLAGNLAVFTAFIFSLKRQEN